MSVWKFDLADTASAACTGMLTRASLCLAGAAADSGNLGVRALGNSVIAGIAERLDGGHITVFDNDSGVGAFHLPGLKTSVSVSRCGARLTRRLYDPSSYGQIGVMLRLGGLGNPAARAVLEADAVLDISGGDSFTDLYGDWRFRAIMAPKRLALAARKPLILLPQTIGPFRTDAARIVAEGVLRRATAIWTRDARSFQVLHELLGDGFDPSIHREGVDVAFLLRAVPPEDAASFAAIDDGGSPVGVNVSGLIWNQPESARSQYGFRADYREILIGLLRRLVVDAGRVVLLIPHVNAPESMYESDLRACRELRDCLEPIYRERVPVIAEQSQPEHAKWVISRCDWFCGTRMHATIASLSTGVPTAAIAYSPKTQGVFESVGQGGHVADPRTLETGEMVESLWASYQQRRAAVDSLREHLPVVLERAGRQLDEVILQVSRSGRSDRGL